MAKLTPKPTPELRRVLDHFCGGRVPAGLTLHRVDDIAQRGTGHTPDKKHPEYWDGGVRWVSLADSHRLDRVFIGETEHTISQAGLANSSAVLHPEGIVMLSRDAGVGKSAVSTCPLAVSQHFVVWRCGEDLHNLYLYYWLQFMKPEFERIANGSTIKTIGMGYFNRFQMLAPERPAQERIASCLYAWDRALAKVNQLIRVRRKLKRGLLQQLLTGQRRFAEFRGEPWVERPFGEVLTESRVPGSHGGSAQKLSIRLYGKGVYTRTDRTGGSDQTQYHRRSAGQLVYSKLDFLNGAFGLVPDELDGYESTLDVPAFDISASVDPRWLLYLLTWPGFYKRQLGIAHGGRKARRVNPEHFLKLAWPMPKRNEQKRIAEALSTLDRELELLVGMERSLQSQKKGLMQKLLTGELRVSTGMEVMTNG
ncbi:MAG: restriction endonuclease subunit S [Phycisphaerales bacterium JB060]